MPKKTQNRVTDQSGVLVTIDSTVESVLRFLPLFDALRFVQATKTVVVDGKKVSEPVWNEDGSPQMGCQPYSGYDKYWNNDGFTNPISVENASAQGIGKLMAKLIQVAHARITAGGDDAAEMQAVLTGVLAYNEYAAKNGVGTPDTSEIQAALKEVQKGAGDAVAAQKKLADYLASVGLPNPAPSIKAVTPEIAPTSEAATEVAEVAETTETATVAAESSEPTVTVEEAATAIATATETPQDEAPVDESTEDIGQPTETAATL